MKEPDPSALDSDRPHLTRRTLLTGSAVAAAGVLGGALSGGGGAEAARGSKPQAGHKPEVGSQPARRRPMPTLYLPHGGGPCFYMDWTLGPKDTWDGLAAWLKGLPATLPRPPKALLVISAHWEAPQPTVLTAAKPPLLYDYSGFPKHTYELKWPAPGSPQLASKVRSLLTRAGIESHANDQRGLDHGVFVPLKLAWPQAEVPTIQLSLQRGLDPAAHLALGAALKPLRDEDVLIIGSGMSYHNMRGFMRPDSRPRAQAFDAWLRQVVAAPAQRRDQALRRWTHAPEARACHPREEHLLPLMVVAGAAGEDSGRVDFSDELMGVQVSACRFG